MKIILIYVTVLLLTFNITISQTKKIEIIEITEIDFYYVYKAIEYEKIPVDTIILLGSKLNNPEFKEVFLQKNKKYEVETRLKSAIKSSNNRYMFCKITQNILNNVIISDKKNLPVLILDFDEIKSGIVNLSYVPNEETAIKIAEAIWYPIYGKQILDKKPFKAKLIDNKIWRVEGTIGLDEIGGVPIIEIQKSDSKILKVTHTK